MTTPNCCLRETITVLSETTAVLVSKFFSFDFMMCIHAAQGILMQCGREYWLDDTILVQHRSINFISKNAKICLLKTWNQKDILLNMDT